MVLIDTVVRERFVKLHICECNPNREIDLRDHSNFDCLNKIDRITQINRIVAMLIKNVYSTGIISDRMVLIVSEDT